MKVLAIIFVVLICVYALFSLVGLVTKIILRKKQRESTQMSEEVNHDGGGSESTDEDKPTE